MTAPRFVWRLATEWFRVKKDAVKLEQFWTTQETELKKFEKDHPETYGSPVATLPAPSLAMTPAPSTNPAPVVSTNATSSTPAPVVRTTPAPGPAPSPAPGPSQVPRPLPLPRRPATGSSPAPAAPPATKPVARPALKVMKCAPKYVNRFDPLQTKEDESEDSEDDAPYDEAGYSDDSEDKTVSKGKAKETGPDTIQVVKKRRAPPKKSDVLRDPPCPRCVQYKHQCHEQSGPGVACYVCAKYKMRCEMPNDGESSQPPAAPKAPKKPKKTAKAPPPPPAHTSMQLESTPASTAMAPPPPPANTSMRLESTPASTVMAPPPPPALTSTVIHVKPAPAPTAAEPSQKRAPKRKPAPDAAEKKAKKRKVVKTAEAVQSEDEDDVESPKSLGSFSLFIFIFTSFYFNRDLCRKTLREDREKAGNVV